MHRASVIFCVAACAQPSNEGAQDFYDDASRSSTWQLDFTASAGNPVGCPSGFASRTASVPSAPSQGESCAAPDCAPGAVDACEPNATCTFSLVLVPPGPGYADHLYLFQIGYGMQTSDGSTLVCVDDDNDVAQVDPGTGTAYCSMFGPSLPANGCEYGMPYLRTR